MAVDPTSMPYRPCVGILMFNARGLVFAARRNDVPGGAWQMPQGGVDEGEDPKAAALRELEEETGVRQVEVVAECADWLHYDLPEPLLGRAWKGRYRGQALKWFAMRFTGDDGDIDVQDVVRPEFDAWKWTPPDELVTMIVPFKRPMYERVVAEFDDLIRAAAAENG